MTPLTRRDRHAMLLALDWAARTSLPRNAETFRKHRDEDARWYVDMARDALDLGSGESDDLRSAMVSRSGTLLHELPGKARIVRARLALALRALLRADRGDYGKRRSTDVAAGERLMRHIEARAHYGFGGIDAVLRDMKAISTRRITPAWQLAPATGTAARPAGLRRRGGL